MSEQISHFTQLEAWRINHSLVLKLYKLTDKFPGSERFGLISQIKRAVISITANIAEGFGRYHYKDKIKFYLIARGSSMEIQNYLIVSHDLNYLSENDFNELKQISFSGYKLICGLISSINKQ